MMRPACMRMFRLAPTSAVVQYGVSRCEAASAILALGAPPPVPPAWPCLALCVAQLQLLHCGLSCRTMSVPITTLDVACTGDKCGKALVSAAQVQVHIRGTMAGQFGYLRSMLSSQRLQESYEFCHAQNATYYHRVDDPGACLSAKPHLSRHQTRTCSV